MFKEVTLRMGEIYESADVRSTTDTKVDKYKQIHTCVYCSDSENPECKPMIKSSPKWMREYLRKD